MARKRTIDDLTVEEAAATFWWRNSVLNAKTVWMHTAARAVSFRWSLNLRFLNSMGCAPKALD